MKWKLIKKTSIYEIDIDENYKKQYIISKKDILKLYNEKKIYEIKRD